MTTPRILGQNSPPQNPRAKVIGWHYDYQLKCGAINNGVTIEAELPILPGAPFCLRGIGAYNVTPAGGGPAVAAALTGAFLQYTDQYDCWLQTALVGTSGDWPTMGNNAQYEPVYNQVVYGPGSVISVRLTNSSGADWADARIVFRGTKLFYEDRIYAPCYPDCYNSLPYEMVTNITMAAPGTPPSFLNEIPIIATGADLVLRGAVLMDNATNGTENIGDLEFLLTDQNLKPYANDFIHHSWLFSTQLANRPGVFYPEFYLPKDRLMLVNAKQGGNTDVNVNLVWNAERIFPK